MRSLKIFASFSNIFFSYFVFAQIDPLHAPTGWVSGRCSSCAPIERLRASAFGIELAPNYLTLAMKFANGTVSRVLKMEPSDAYVTGMMSWVWQENFISQNIELGSVSFFLDLRFERCGINEVLGGKQSLADINILPSS